MEVGAVKQAFNNEIILLKKNLNQAKIQTIHKLTRKAKTLIEKKCPENLKDKQKRKAESAVREVLIIKKIKPKDIARFIVTHTGKLNEYLNKPIVDNDKACARLLLHKALQEKYNHIRGKFSNISIKDLFMSRQERLKLKKEAREKQKNKKKGKENSSTVNVEGEWDVENTDRSKETIEDETLKDGEVMSDDDDKMSDDDDKMSNDDDKMSNDDDKMSNDDDKMSDDDEMSDNDDETSIKNSALSDKSDASDQSDDKDEKLNDKNVDIGQKDSGSENNEDNIEIALNEVVKKDSKNKTKLIKPNSEKFEINFKTNNKSSENKAKKVDKKIKDNKNKNLNEKLQKRKFNKESDDLPAKLTKVVDPFFVTSTGENYMSLVEPRNPDEIKEVHKEGNRKYRRAVMFGHVPKIKPKKNNYQSNNSFDKNDKFGKISNNKNKEFDVKQKRNNFTRKEDRRNDDKDVVPEKLHPSWEAKKKQSAILPFKGKKTVFD